jgi:hypothetical protein
MTDKEYAKQMRENAVVDDNGIVKVSKELWHQIADVIEEQQMEIDRLKARQIPTAASGYKVENGKVVFYTNMLAGYRHEYKTLDEVVDALNAMLKNCYDKDEIADYFRATYKKLGTARAEAIKEFADKFDKVLAEMRDAYFEDDHVSYGLVCETVHARLVKYTREMVGADNG